MCGSGLQGTCPRDTLTQKNSSHGKIQRISYVDYWRGDKTCQFLRSLPSSGSFVCDSSCMSSTRYGLCGIMGGLGRDAPSSFADGGNRTRRNLELRHPNLQMDTWNPLATHLFTKIIKIIFHNCLHIIIWLWEYKSNCMASMGKVYS